MTIRIKQTGAAMYTDMFPVCHHILQGLQTYFLLLDSGFSYDTLPDSYPFSKFTYIYIY